MNENIDLTKILKDCPIGTKLYSSILGDVIFDGINVSKRYPILIKNNYIDTGYTTKGCYFADSEGNSIGECILFPSKEQRDWSKFELPKKECEFKPFQKVLVRDSCTEYWRANIFSDYIDEDNDYPYQCIGGSYACCIPYEGNENLLGTTKDIE